MPRRRRVTFKRTRAVEAVEVTVTEDTEDLAVLALDPWQRFPLACADPLDRSVPVPLTEPAPVFWYLLRHPPVRAPWRPHLAFTVEEAARAVLQDACPPPAVTVAVPRTYPELAEDTLAHEFAETGDPGASPLELTLGRST
jgi:hypothetical protein